MKIDHVRRWLPEYTLEIDEMAADEVRSGTLVGRGQRIPVRQGIPRFVSDDGYAENFAIQWTRFRATQLDSASGIPLTATRLWSTTGWTPEELAGKTVLEVGSGAGRFTEVLLEAGATVVSFDLSAAVDANWASTGGKGELFLFQGDVYDLPLIPGSFDYVLCFGVLQHTPDPETAYRAIERMAAPGGRICIDWYRTPDGLDPWATPKYAWRRWTAHCRPERLLRIIRLYMPMWLPVDSLLRSIPVIGGKIIAFLRIPCWNYLRSGLSYRQRLEWAIMDTFDALGATYDHPRTEAEVSAIVGTASAASTTVFRGGTGIVARIEIQPTT